MDLKCPGCGETKRISKDKDIQVVKINKKEFAIFYDCLNCGIEFTIIAVNTKIYRSDNL